MIKISVQHDNFDVTNELKSLTEGNHNIGATVSFIGLVRDLVDEKLLSMTLEHYPAMTKSQLKEIATEASQKWHLEGITIIHRFGELFPGDQIVLVIAASQHRHNAFDAANFIMDFLKTRAPFWKKETTNSKDSWVKMKSEDEESLKKWH